MKCVICGKELPANRKQDTCDHNCYYKKWYREHKDIRDRSRKYIPHPRVLRTEEEKKQIKKEYYQKNRDKLLSYSKKYCHEYYLKHKDDEHYRELNRKHAREYMRRRRENEKRKKMY